MAKSRSFLKTLTWMLPGYEIKRWLLMFAVGFSSVVLGIAILFNLQPVTFILNMIKWLATLAPFPLRHLLSRELNTEAVSKQQ